MFNKTNPLCLGRKAKMIFTAAATLFALESNGQWALTGNAGTDTVNNFIGTTDNRSLRVRTNNQVRMHFDRNGRIGIGTTSPQTALDLYSAASATAFGIRSDAGSAFIFMDKQNATDNATVSYRTNGTAIWQTGTFANNDFAIKNLPLGNAITCLSSNNNVGIGTASPTEKLTVVATGPTSGLGVYSSNSGRIGMEMGRSNTAELSLGIADGPGSFVTGSVAGDAVFRTNSGANNFLFASGGGGAPVTLAITPTSVGIGTTTPFAQLSNSTTNIYGTDGYGLSSSAFGWGSTDGFGYAAGFYNAGTGIASNGVTVKIQGSQGTVLDLSASDTVSVMTVKGNGNVGMGTTAPTSRLTVVSTPANIPAVNVLPVPGSARVNVAVGDWSLLQDYFGSGVSKDFSLYQNSKGLHRMLIDTAGNVGFGTTTPDRPLVVRSADNTLNSQVSELANGIGDANFHLVATKGATTNNPGDIMTRLGLAYGDNGASVDGSFIRFHRGIAGNDGSTSFSSGADVERMRITSSGRVGIGTTGPGGQFELSLDQGRKPLTNTWTIVSDARLKNIDGAYSKGLKEIMQLNPIAYHYKNVGERKFENEVLNTQAVGFTAQDVQKVFPEAVGTDADGYLNLNIHSIIVAQVNAIKELGAQNEVKDAKIAELQNENAAMHAELNDMKQCVESLCANNESKTQNSELKTENYLFQNQPNPFNQTTVISYQLLSDAKNASIVIRGLNGEELKSVSLSNTGKGQVTINANELAQGTYTYTLIVNGKSVDTKLMVVTR